MDLLQTIFGPSPKKTFDSQKKMYQCFYLQRSRDSVFPVCGFFCGNFPESAHQADSVSKLQCLCVSVFVSVPLFFFDFSKCLFTPTYKGLCHSFAQANREICMDTIFMDEQRNFHGCTKELAWTLQCFNKTVFQQNILVNLFF